ncbi:hypothetical protein D9M71_685750 [compost metagenome]
MRHAAASKPREDLGKAFVPGPGGKAQRGKHRCRIRDGTHAIAGEDVLCGLQEVERCREVDIEAAGFERTFYVDLRLGAISMKCAHA